MSGAFSNGARRAEVEAWWALVARIIAFFLGALILAYTVIFSAADGFSQVAFAAIGVGLMGPVAVQGVAQALESLRGGGRNG